MIPDGELQCTLNRSFLRSSLEGVGRRKGRRLRTTDGNRPSTGIRRATVLRLNCGPWVVTPQT